MDNNECIDCGETENLIYVESPQACDDECRFGCRHATEDVYLCQDCLDAGSTEAADRAYRRAEQGYCE